METVKNISFANYIATDNDAPAIKVTTRKKQVVGNAFAVWIDLEKCANVETFFLVATDAHIDEEQPKWVFVDSRNLPCALVAGNVINEETFCLMLSYYYMEEDERKALDVYLGISEKATYEGFKQSYVGTFESKEAYARSVINEYYNTNDKRFPWQFFDYKAFSEWLFSENITYIQGIVLK